MGKLGIIAEGEYGLPVLRTFIQKSIGHHINTELRVCHGEGNVLKVAPAFLEELNELGGFDKVFVVRDLGVKGNTSYTKLKKQVENKLREIDYAFPVKVGIMVKEMEAWLLADETALSEITGRTVRKLPSPETIKEPKGQLKSLLSNATPTKLPYTPRVAEDIATLIDINVLVKRCRSFKDFHESIHDC